MVRNKTVYLLKDHFGVLGIFTSMKLVFEYQDYYKKNWPDAEPLTLEYHILDRTWPEHG